jgi:hypothetical protein
MTEVQNTILETTDVRAWAKEFADVARRKIKEMSGKDPAWKVTALADMLTDEVWLISWFANLVETVKRIDCKSLAQMQAEVYDNNVAHGWFDDDRPFGTGNALLHSEVSEAFEEYRDHGIMGYVLDKSVHPDAPDVILIADPKDYGDRKPLGVPSEYADILIRLLDSCQRDGVDLMAEYEAKMKYNRTRPYKHGNKTV